MRKSARQLVFACLSTLFATQMAMAKEVVDLPQEELAQESVYPVFDKPVSVKNRNVVTAKRIDADIFYGMALTEPIADVSKIGLGVYYNFNENHALGVLFAKNSTGLANYAKQLHDQFGLDFNRVPKPDSTLMLDYNIKAFYGKMSLTKSMVFNLALYGTISAGIVKYSHKSFPAAAIGFGQKFYFTDRFALRADLRLYGHQAPVPFLDGYLRDGTGATGGAAQPVPTPDMFKERVTYTTNLDVGLSFLF